MATLETRITALETLTQGMRNMVALLLRNGGTLTPISDNIRPMHPGETEEAYRADALAGFDKILIVQGVKPGVQNGNA